MAEPFSLGKIDVELAAAMERPAGVPEPDTPFRILLLGDLSGRSNRGVHEPGAIRSGRGPLRVDRDDFDQVLGGLGAELHLDVAGQEGSRVTLRFDGLDAFHPDAIFGRVAAFGALKETREKLMNPETYREAAVMARAWAEKGMPPRAPEELPEEGAPAPGEGQAGSEDLVKELLEAGRRRAREPGRSPGGEDWQGFLRRIVQPHLVPREEPEKATLVALVDRAASALMRAILHHPDFQALEAGWRAVEFLVRRLELNSELQLHVLDVSKAELAADLASEKDLRATGVYTLLVEDAVGTPGGTPWAIVAGNYTFAQTVEDTAFLDRMATVARDAGAPFLAGAGPPLIGCASLAETPDPAEWRSSGGEAAETWGALRKRPEAGCLGLALPRFLLRLPYGKDTEPLEQFAFEELPDGSGHEDYLWGNPAFACACLLGQAFSEYGWGFRPGVFQEIDGLPLHVYKQGGESRAKPCAEALLTLRAAEVVLEKGLMPLLSIQARDAVRLGRFQSVRDPLTPLAGRWGS